MCGSLLCFVCLDKSLEHVGSADREYTAAAAVAIMPHHLTLDFGIDLKVLSDAEFITATNVETGMVGVSRNAKSVSVLVQEGKASQRIETMSFLDVKHVVEVEVNAKLRNVVILEEIVRRSFATQVVDEVVGILGTNTEVVVTMVETNVQVSTH